MSIRLKPGFLSDCRRLHAQQRLALFDIILNLRQTLADASAHSGVGLRMLHPTDIWEVRIGLEIRAVFALARNEAIFLTVGTHDEIRRFLKGR